MKFCKKCQCETERYASGGCKTCVKKYATERRLANPEKAKEASAKWRAANPDRNKANKAAWSASNKQKVNSYKLTWRLTNPGYYKIYRAKNLKKLSASSLIHVQNRRARKRANGGFISKDLPSKLFKLQKGKCPCCKKPLGKKYHLDHIVPLALGGPNSDDNMQLLRASCNLQKHAKHPIDFMQSRGFLL